MPEKSQTNYLLYAALAAGAYFLFFKDKKGEVSKNKVVDVTSTTENIEKQASEAAKKGAAAAAKQEEEENELTVPIAQSASLVDYTLSGKELLGIQEGAGVVNPA